MTTSLKPHMLEDARNYAEVLDTAAMAFDTHPDGTIPPEICDISQLIELLELVGEDAIKQHIYDQEAKDTLETIRDNHYAGAPR